MTQKGYFVPLSVIHRYTLPPEIGGRKETALINGFKIPGMILDGPREALKRFVHKADLTKVEECTLENLVHDVWSGSSSLMTEIDLEDLDPALLESIQATLITLSDYAGEEFHLHFPVRGHDFPPLGGNDKDLHFVIGASPPGEAPALSRSQVCGIDLVLLGKNPIHHGPAKGRGGIVYDEDDRPIGQIIGHTIYILIFPCPETVIKILFECALRYIWNAFIDGTAKPASSEELDAVGFNSRLEIWTQTLPVLVKDTIAEINKEIAQTERKLRELHHKKRTYIGTLRGAELMIGGFETRMKRWVEDFTALRALPSVSKVLFVDEAFHIELHSVAGEFDARYYRFGPQIIRIGIEGKIDIWSPEPTHPDGRSHPHISIQGAVCFGNFSVPIQEAALKWNILETVELIVRWFKEGYEPSLADALIEEWPREESNESNA